MESDARNTAIYARVSSDSQDVELSISAQLRAVREYATSHGHLVVREFVDQAESGRTAQRPAFREMISLAKLKDPPFSAILVWKLNRFARSRADSVTFKTLLRKKGIDVISINEPVDDSPTGRLIEGVIESIDEFYSANLGQDIKRGLREAAKRGFYVGARPPMGMRKVGIKEGEKTRYKLEPEPQDSPWVKLVTRMFDMARAGLGCKEITKTFNGEGSRTPVGERWSKVTVHKVLTNEAYCGTLVLGGRPGHPALRSGEPPVRVESAWPPLVDKETFDTVQRKLKAKSPRKVHPRTVCSPYLLTGMTFCGCGAALTGQSAKSGRHFYYACSRGLRQGKMSCGAPMLPKEKLEQAVIGQIKARVLTERNIEELVKMMNDELRESSGGLKDKLDVIDAELRDSKARLSRLYEALETGKLTLDDLAPRIRELKGRNDDLSRMRVQTEAELAVRGVQEVDLAPVKAYSRSLQALLKEAELTERKSFLRSFVKRIEVDHGQVVIHYSLPMPPEGNTSDRIGVLSTVTLGGEGGTRTPTPCGT